MSGQRRPIGGQTFLGMCGVCLTSVGDDFEICCFRDDLRGLHCRIRSCQKFLVIYRVYDDVYFCLLPLPRHAWG